MKRSSLSVKNIRNNLFVKYNLKLIWIKFTLISYKQMNMNDLFQSSVSKILQRSIKLMWSDKLSFKYNNQRANWWWLWQHKELSEHNENQFIFIFTSITKLFNLSSFHQKINFCCFLKKIQISICKPMKVTLLSLFSQSKKFKKSSNNTQFIAGYWFDCIICCYLNHKFHEKKNNNVF